MEGPPDIVGSCPACGPDIPSLPLAVSSIALAITAVVVWWAVTGVLLLVLLWVRRVERPPWGAASALLGPLLLGWALAQVRTRQRHVEIAAGSQGDGDVHVLIVVPNDPTRVALLDPILRGIGSDLGNVILSRPLRGDGGDRTRRDDVAIRDLSRAALFLSAVDPRLVVIPDLSVRTLRYLMSSEEVSLVIALDDDRAVLALRRVSPPWNVAVIAPASLAWALRRSDRRPRWPPADGG